MLVVIMFVPSSAFAAPSERGGSVHIVQRGETLSAIAARYGVSQASLASANNIRNPNIIYSGMRLWIPGSSGGAAGSATGSSSSAGGGSYIVRRGDTLSMIAARYGVSVAALKQANGIRNANRIYVNQRLSIPGRSASSNPPAASPPWSLFRAGIREGESGSRLIFPSSV